MKKISFLVGNTFSIFLLFSTIFVVLGVSGVSYTNDLKVFELTKTGSDLKPETVVSDSEQRIARSGCCSWHGGVCDCIGGRIVCCDGTFSPSCLCNRESNKRLIDVGKHP